MFCQTFKEENEKLLEKQHENNSRSRKRKIKKQNRLRNRNQQRFKRDAIKTKVLKSPKFALTMSSWAENFARASTWQLRHELACWKAKTKALEYENKILHDIIRRNCFSGHTTVEPHVTDSEETDSEESSQMQDDLSSEGGDIEATEEWIQFLTENAKFKEDAKRERERLKAQRERPEEIIHIPPKTAEESEEEMKKLYGDKWERVSALETSMAVNYLVECEKTNPVYWPNIPLNLKFS